jgi:hypothetical protein
MSPELQMMDMPDGSTLDSLWIYIATQDPERVAPPGAP